MSDFIKQQQPLILASGSSIRFKLLQTLGLEFTVVPSYCDEDAIKASRADATVLTLGQQLAAAKALAVSADYPQHFIIGADQLCVINELVLDKPGDHATAIKHLQLLRGQTHQQISCVCIAYQNNIVWQHHDSAYLTMRNLSDHSIEQYLKLDQPYNSCGAYQYETAGKWLFQKVQGNEDTILGLPLQSLSNALLDLNVLSI